MQNHTANELPLDADEIGLKDLLEILWTGKLLIACVTFGFAIVAVIAAWVLPKTYEAVIVISPVSASNGSSSFGSGGMGGLGSQLSGLAALAGVTVGADSKKSESIAVLQSEQLTRTFIQQRNLLPILFYRKWDSAAKKWKVSDPKDVPTLWRGNQFFKKNVRSLSTDSKTGLVTLTVAWRNAEQAAEWANGLVAMTNAFLRDKAISESERNIAYLYQEAAKSNVVEARQAIFAVLETEINKQMLARGATEYAFKVLDSAMPPEKASSPKKIVWLLMGLIGGFFLSSLFVLVRAARRNIVTS
jgi:uncharacterized protein involved in exopolysaccharide biosynthesis